VAAEDGGLIKKEKKKVSKKVHAWVKLKAFPINVKRPNYSN